MLLSKKLGALTVAGLLFSTQVMADDLEPLHHEQLIVPHCLQENIEVGFNVIASDEKFSLLEVASKDLDAIARTAESKRCGKFINVSQKMRAKTKPKSLLAQYTHKKRLLNAGSFEIKHPAEVEALLPRVNSANIWQTLIHMTDTYDNRSATTDYGLYTAHWLKEQFEAMAKAYQRNDVATYFVETGYWYKQPSVVTVIGKDIKADAVVLGAHMDTLSGKMPGAGDDASGSSSLMETARVLLSSKKPLKHPVYIIWYAAEERGLVGSQYVVSDFQKKRIPVKAAIQFDMTGFRNDANDNTIWVYTDSGATHPGLSAFVEDLLKTYVKVKISHSQCGYGCSDHVSWSNAGVPAAFPCETDFPHHNPNIHTANDRKEYLNLEHMTNFSKLGVAFAVELAS